MHLYYIFCGTCRSSLGGQTEILDASLPGQFIIQLEAAWLGSSAGSTPRNITTLTRLNTCSKRSERSSPESFPEQVAVPPLTAGECGISVACAAKLLPRRLRLCVGVQESGPPEYLYARYISYTRLSVCQKKHTRVVFLMSYIQFIINSRGSRGPNKHKERDNGKSCVRHFPHRAITPAAWLMRQSERARPELFTHNKQVFCINSSVVVSSYHTHDSIALQVMCSVFSSWGYYTSSRVDATE